MRDTNPTAAVSDILRLIWARTGNPRQQRKLSANADALTRMAATAREVSAQAAALADHLDALAAACANPGCEWCGNPLPIRATGRPALYCDDACGRAARKARTTAAGVSGQPVVGFPTGTDTRV